MGGSSLRYKEPKTEYQRPESLRPIAIIFGIVLAAVGGVIAYRAFFVEPSSVVVISNSGVRELPDTLRVLGGILLLVLGAVVAFTAARRGKK